MNDKIKQLNQYITDLQMTEDNFNMLKEFVISSNLDNKPTHFCGVDIRVVSEGKYKEKKDDVEINNLLKDEIKKLQEEKKSLLETMRWYNTIEKMRKEKERGLL